MADNEAIKKLLEISNEQWRKIIAKCHNHIDIKLYQKTSSGAHCEQRLGMPAHDYYFSRAYESIYDGIWNWNIDKYSIEEQFIRIIDSMISEQVRKYKIEIKRNKTIVLVENEQLNLFENLKDEEDGSDENYYNKLSTALQLVCKDNDLYQTFIGLKRKGSTYENICIQMKCSIKEAYRIREAIARKAIKILKTL